MYGRKAPTSTTYIKKPKVFPKLPDLVRRRAFKRGAIMFALKRVLGRQVFLSKKRGYFTSDPLEIRTFRTRAAAERYRLKLLDGGDDRFPHVYRVVPMPTFHKTYFADCYGNICYDLKRSGRRKSFAKAKREAVAMMQMWLRSKRSWLHPGWGSARILHKIERTKKAKVSQTRRGYC
jgi:hypothetical protein